jgi:hypothetical protein
MAKPATTAKKETAAERRVRERQEWEEADKKRQAEQEVKNAATRVEVAKTVEALGQTCTVVRLTYGEPILKNPNDGTRLVKFLSETFEGKFTFTVSATHGTVSVSANPVVPTFSEDRCTYYIANVLVEYKKIADQGTAYWPTFEYLQAFAKGYEAGVKDSMSDAIPYGPPPGWAMMIRPRHWA